MEGNLPLSTTLSSQRSSPEVTRLRKPSGSDCPPPINGSVNGGTSTKSSENVATQTCAETTSTGGMGVRLRDKVLEMDRVHAMQEALTAQVSHQTAVRITRGKRQSTLTQQQVAWSALQSWLKSNPDQDISEASLLEFFSFLKDKKGLCSSTIRNYRTYLYMPLKIIAKIDLKDWKFVELENSFFLESPMIRPSMPSWSVQNVLNLLKSRTYNNRACSLYFLLKKTVFLTALATGNRVSEIAAMYLPWNWDHGNEELQIPVKPGFLYKNQRAGRCPPNIKIKSFMGGAKSICPVSTLKAYVTRSKGKRGPLFRNSSNGNQLRPCTISKILCSVIEEAQPGCVPKAHDVRKAATSIAWTRGLEVKDIISRSFWSNSNTFIDRYLSPTSAEGVALNTS